MATTKFDTLDALLLGLISLHLFLAPYTKVEESFNLQAIHDVFIHGVSSDAISKYDHVTFPGVVPRTFIGPLIFGLSMSFLRPIQHLVPFIAFQYVARGMIGLANGIALITLRRAVNKTFGSLAGTCFLMICCCQFHLIFYSSRPLPNMLALCPMVLASSHWIKSQDGITQPEQSKCIRNCIILMIFTGTVFRFEVGGLLIPLVLLELLRKRIRLATVLYTGAITFVSSLGLTIAIDSFFWQQNFLWPEGVVFYFNGIQGKSSEWGTSPWHAYFSSLLPKLLTISIPLAIFGMIVDLRTRVLLIPPIVFVGLYSLIAHKEWRFIVYVVPLINVVGAVGASFILRRSGRTITYGLLSVGIIGLVLACFAASTGMMLVSGLNYPGGEALAALHSLEPCNASVSVHIDTYTAMTGASLFGQLCPEWVYSKNESLGNDTSVYTSQFTHLLTHEPLLHKDSYDVVKVIRAYGGIQLDTSRLNMDVDLFERFPLGIKMQDDVWILQRLPRIPH